MKSAFFRRGTALLLLLGLALLAIAVLAVLGGERAAVSVFAARGDALYAVQPPIPSGEINVNTANAQTLEKLPGVGEAIAGEIIKEREANGPFHYPEDLKAVKGIGEKKLEGMLPHIRLDEQP